MSAFTAAGNSNMESASEVAPQSLRIPRKSALRRRPLFQIDFDA